MDANGRSDSDPRVVSLAPSSTATLVAMGAADCLVGVTAHCDIARADAGIHADVDAPADADTPHDTDAPANTDTDVPVVGGWLNPDHDRIAELDPDLVCTSDGLQADVRDELRAAGHEVCHVEPERLSDVLDSFEALGRAVGRPDAGVRLAADCRRRLAAVEARTPDEDRPTVYCEEWSDPPMAAGNWVPDAVAAAGGVCPFVDPGARSREVAREAVEDADPDHVVLHLCGRGDSVSPASFRDRGWDVDAAVHALDDSLLNQPSPALFDGIETLADLFHGDGSSDGPADA